MMSKRRTVDRHAATLEAMRTFDFPQNIVVVDDVITSGATLFAATQTLADAFPDAAVRAFALIRTLSDEEIPETEDQCLAPCVGAITLNPDGTTVREP